MIIDFVSELSKVSPRYGLKEVEAANLIKQELGRINVSFIEQPFETAVPFWVQAELKADGELVPCTGSSLVSGEIPDGKFLISSFGYSGEAHPYNISYSPITDEIALTDIYKVPSVTVSRLSVVKLVMAKEIKGQVVINKQSFKTENLLVGNLDNPKNIVFGHYDSVVGDGAVDNAGAISVMIDVIRNNHSLLKNSLFVFSGNEEVSYDDYKTKSGFGFRVFESKYGKLLESCSKIIVLDGVGIGSPTFSQNGLDWVLQIKMLDRIIGKVLWLQNDQSLVLQYFHTKLDTINNIKEEYLQEASVLLSKELD